MPNYAKGYIELFKLSATSTERVEQKRFHLESAEVVLGPVRAVAVSHGQAQATKTRVGVAHLGREISGRGSESA